LIDFLQASLSASVKIDVMCKSDQVFFSREIKG